MVHFVACKFTEIIMECIWPTDYVSKGLSSLSQFLFYRQQLLTNPCPGPWWQTGRRCEQCRQSFFNLQVPKAICISREPKRNRCARFLLSLFPDPSTTQLYRRNSFTGSWTVCSIPVSTMKGISDVEENVVGMKFQAVNFLRPSSRLTRLAFVGSCHHLGGGYRQFGHRKSHSNGLSSCWP